MDNIKKVLIIAYNYPPIGGVGIIRTLKFSKYLSKYGWIPQILTVKNRDRFYTSAGNDELPEGVHVHRSKNITNNRNYSAMSSWTVNGFPSANLFSASYTDFPFFLTVEM
jgi:hypothetical protein